MVTYFTSESVCKGHPDKVCDIIADSILDEALKINPNCHNAVEATIKDKTVLIYGETDTPVDYETIAKDVISEIGYDGQSFEVICRVSEQSSEINDAVVNSTECRQTAEGATVEDLDAQGAGDQGIVFGYACNEVYNAMPLSISLAHKIAQELDSIDSPKLLPDGKTQVTVKYDGDQIVGISTILVSKQHTPDTTPEELFSLVYGAIMDALFNLGVERYYSSDTEIIVNPSGSFTIGGPEGDSGTTGRKIVVDTYGGHGRVGGGCFSSKDPSKVDRSAAYYARYVAKNIVISGRASKCEIQVSYGIGMAAPISVHINCFRTNKVPMKRIYNYVKKNFDFRPANIIQELDLRRPIYKDTACYGHFGHISYPWESVNIPD